MILLVVPPVLCSAQNGVDSRFRHFTVEDGLPSSNLFYVHQDSKGFMWFTSDAGVTKYDGYTFKNFTRSDGLPDNMILSIFEDSKERLWLRAMKWELSYIKNDSIHMFNPENKLESLTIRDITQDSDGVLWFCFSNGGIFSYDRTTVEPFRGCGAPEKCFSLRATATGEMMVGPGKDWGTIKNDSVKMHHLPDSLINTSPSPVAPTRVFVTAAGERLALLNRHILFINESNSVGAKLELPAESYLNMLSEGNAGTLFAATTKGVFIIEKINGSYQIMESMMESKNVNMVMEDTEGSLWFTTAGDGIYLLSNNARKMKTIYTNEAGSSVVQAIAKFPETGTICLATYGDNIHFIQGDARTTINFAIESVPENVNDLFIDKNGTLWCCFDGGLIMMKESEIKSFSRQTCRSTPDKLIPGTGSHYSLPANCNHLVLSSVKSVVPGNNNDMWVNTSTMFHNLSRDEQGNIIDKVISITRTSDACLGSDGRVWWGSPMGLNFFDSDGKMDSIPRFLKDANIADLETNKHGIIWIATNGSGIYAFREDSSLLNITTKNGLSSDIVNAIVLDDTIIWAATARGLEKIVLRGKDYRIFHINKSDGLPSDEINEVFVDDRIVFVATNKGLATFNKDQIQPVKTPPPVYISMVEIEGRDTALLASYSVDHAKNDLVIQFVSPNYESPEKTTYKYKLAGTDDDWKTTSLREINYSQLKPGQYTFMVKAVNADGYESTTAAELPITIAPPYWQTAWFIAVVILAALLVVAGIIFAIIRYYRNRNRLTNRIFEAEQKALRAQMNPHFVFNALYSIQHFITKNDQYSANMYLAKFSDLVRMTLDYSRNVNISVAEELKFLKTYLELESLRFENKFDYQINVDTSVDVYKTKILSMLIQPFAENSIKHGLLPKKTKGSLTILLRKENSHLTCIIEDNGIGREKAMELKSKKSSARSSQGIAITQERLDLMKNGEAKGSILLIDLKDPDGNVAGTRVVLQIPYSES